MLGDEVRRELYAFIRAAHRPISREEAAARAGISRKLAAFHLDKLVSAGLLRARYDPQPGLRRVGRTPKTYEPAETDIAVTIPPRQHEVLARILVDAVLAGPGASSGTAAAGAAGETGQPGASSEPSASCGPGASGSASGAGATGSDTVSAAAQIARARGRELGAAERTRLRPGRLGPERALTLAGEILAGRGFEPQRTAPTGMLLRNCPFHPLAARAPALVCGINHAYLSGLLAGLGAETVEAILDPQPACCCVRLAGAAR